VHEPEAAARAAAAVGPIARVEAVQGFVGNQTFRLRTAAGQTFYLKSGDAIEAEAHACELARSVGVPAPRNCWRATGSSELPHSTGRCRSTGCCGR
jgi:hypothetical protein